MYFHYIGDRGDSINDTRVGFFFYQLSTGFTYSNIGCQLVQWTSTKNPTKRVGLVQSGPHHHLLEN